MPMVHNEMSIRRRHGIQLMENPPELPDAPEESTSSGRYSGPHRKAPRT
jgi:hypothetical protein